MHLMGFTSTLLNRQHAESYALLDYEAKKSIPVIAKITMNTRYKYFQFDRPEFSAYYDEYQEVLLQDGIGFQVQSIEEVTYKPNYLNALPNIKDWGLNFTDSIKFTVLNLVFK